MIKCLNDNCDYFNNHGECSEVCERNGFKKVITNYDRIMSMSLDELHEFLKEICLNKIIKGEILNLRSVQGLSYNDMIKVWLENEVSE